MREKQFQQICVIGSINADLTVRAARLPKPGESVAGGPLQVLPGGKSANQAAAAGRLGATVSLVGMVGDDSNGEMLLRSLSANGVRTTSVGCAENIATGTAMITVDDQGENFIIASPGANGMVGPDLVDAHVDLIESCGVLGLTFEVPMAANIRAAEIAANCGTQVVLNPSPFKHPPAELLRHVDVLVVNEHEFGLLLPNSDLRGDITDSARFLAAQGVRSVVITLGSRGAGVLFTGLAEGGAAGEPRYAEIAAPKVDAIDTTGCGDAFTGSLMLGLATGQELADSVRTACAVGAYAATSLGAQSSYPDSEQLAVFLASQPALAGATGL
ncbi:ribokinase [Jonesiaceae bacterium BS-20]|uniref:Ribokinase n=1 Tax=Jonesiaceae bacterium BS-20 TaxID=3120821 RepID=A0AAU7DW52_9MICO